MHVTSQEIMEGLLEHGALYSHDEYVRALTLISNNNPCGQRELGPEDTSKRLAEQLHQLENIFSGDTV